MCLTVDADEHLIKMPAPQRIGSMANTAFPDLGGKQRTKAVLPVPHGLMANVDAALEQKIFDLSQRQGVADIQHHRAADYLRRTVEITKGILHRRRLRNLTSQLKPIYSDNAIMCLSVNDIFVMDAWGKDQNVGENVTMVADGGGAFAKALGLELDLTERGLGVRSQRYSMIVDDGGVSALNVDAGGAFEVSSAEKILEQL